ncbi:uncharacterized protein FFB20_00121 [Fusarium fujikuroi]|uniref:Uncharacterized protein n=1 Tax=Fusarium mangiferae TaxID=192010 RepID=A0A1L7T7G3_FUSMA|nr:uncharacterized protein FMAN_07071 [Fusarium mangiferae]SCN63904.1 uncharacterized protein FFB20_00121 [Fusarium fujikuroi]SCN76884.1 uncharacterized protein FFC1_02463 [Fusarium fujikuroi]SCO31233.1 uncharacterized protein FFNC_01925 [Fusarium fujikuroi]SCV28686.1 uncharacterized protein FFB14_01904 [Fusarium fujikuroi]
MAQTLSPEILM